MWVEIKPGRKKWLDSPQKKKRIGKAPYVIPDIEPYKAVCGDMAGKYITSRSEHREFTKRNGLIEVGNEHREFFEYSGKTRDNPLAKRDPGYERIRAELEGRTRR